MANFNTASLKASNEYGIPMSLIQSNDYNEDLDNIGILGKGSSQVQALGRVNQGRVSEFNQLCFKYPGFVGWRVATVDDQGRTISNRIPYIVFKQHMEASLRMGLVRILGPWTKPYERDEDRHAVAFGMATYGLSAGNILGESSGLMSGLGSYLVQNRKHINLR